MTESTIVAEPPLAQASKSGYTFLSREWTHEVVKRIQGSRARDAQFHDLTSEFTLNLLYQITDFPPTIRGLYGDGVDGRLDIFVRLEKGSVKKLDIGIKAPEDKPDFTVSSRYTVARQIFTNELNAATSFVSRQIKIEPLAKVYLRPKFTAKAVVAANQILKIAREVPTLYPAER